MQSICTALLLLPAVDHLTTSLVAYYSHHPAAVSELRRDYLRRKQAPTSWTCSLTYMYCCQSIEAQEFRSDSGIQNACK